MKKNKKKLKLLKGEIFMYFVLIGIIIMIPVSNVLTKTLLSETNITLEKLKIKIDKQEKTNESLEMQINELVSMENIQKVADLYGLSFNSDNIISINK